MTKRLPKPETIEPFPGCEEAKRHKKMYGLTADQLRQMAQALEAQARRIHNIADDVEALRDFNVERLPMIPQALCSIIFDSLPEYVTKEVVDRHDTVVKKIGRKRGRSSP